MSKTVNQTERATCAGGMQGVDTEALERARLQFENLEDELRTAATLCTNECEQSRSRLAPLALCPAAWSPESVNRTTHERCEDTSIQLSSCLQETQIRIDRLSVLADRAHQVTDALARAEGVYRETESSVFSLLARLLGIFPGHGFIAGFFLAPSIVGGFGLLRGFPGWDSADLMQKGDKLLQPGMDDLAKGLEGPHMPDLNKSRIPKARSRTPVNDAARDLAGRTAPLENAVQGNRLTVTEVAPSSGGGIAASSDVASALENLDRLGNVQACGVPYSTIAVQKYVEEDGTSHFLVYIPGTRNESDTPIGWLQNIELMSSDSSQRLKADSARFALEALRQAGVRKGDSVAIVGHSQGGIVAASLASGKTGYNITHIITAGSPIAGHPIPRSVGVTSIENTGEGVSRLDGRDNPRLPNWVTVTGNLERSKTQRPRSGTTVKGTNGKDQLTHGMNYHIASWKDAKKQHLPTVEASDKHFRQQIRGRLVSTRYFTGRMSH